ncbi:ABC-type enterobactin transport system permease subunit [Planotetraspora sp. GP83]
MTRTARWGSREARRAVTALLVGAALGLAGAIFQSVVRNPLGSPDVLGFTQGSSPVS